MSFEATLQDKLGKHNPEEVNNFIIISILFIFIDPRINSRYCFQIGKIHRRP